MCLEPDSAGSGELLVNCFFGVGFGIEERKGEKGKYVGHTSPMRPCAISEPEKGDIRKSVYFPGINIHRLLST